MKPLLSSTILLAIIGMQTLIAQPTQKELLEQPEIKFVDTGPFTIHALAHNIKASKEPITQK
jgi:hypothetical protein